MPSRRTHRASFATTLTLFAATAATAASAATTATAGADAPSAARSSPDGVEQIDFAAAIALLDADNPSLQQAAAEGDAARGRLRQAIAALLPTVAATGGYTHQNAEVRMSVDSIFDGIESGLNQLSPTPITLDRREVPDDILIQAQDQWTGAVAVRVPLFAGGAYAQVAAALRAIDARVAMQDGARVGLQTALAQAAWMSEAAQGFVDATERAVATARSHEAMTRRGAAVGLYAELALLQARTEVAAREADLVRARAVRDRTWLALGALLGRDGPVRVLPPAPAEGASTDAVAIQEAMLRRPEVRAQVARLTAARAMRTAGWLRLAPTVAGTFMASASDVPFPTGLHGAWRVGVELQWAVFDGGFRYGVVQEAGASVAAAESALREQKVTTAREVGEAAREVDVAVEALVLAQTQRDTAAAAAASAERAFAAGTVGSAETLDAAQRAYAAEIAAIDAQARLAIARLLARKALGLPVASEASDR